MWGKKLIFHFPILEKNTKNFFDGKKYQCDAKNYVMNPLFCFVFSSGKTTTKWVELGVNCLFGLVNF